MSEHTRRYRLERPFSVSSVRSAVSVPPPTPATQPEAATPEPPLIGRAARLLALAHRIEQLAENRGIADYAQAARVFGMTRPRMTQVMNLLRLSPEIQEQILTGSIVATERSLRTLAGLPNWEHQRAALAASNGDSPLAHARKDPGGEVA